MNSLRRFYLPLLLLAIVLYAWRPIGGGEDFWAHAAIGRWTLENGRAPDRTLFLWSADLPWVFHAYGSGVVYATLLEWGGAALAVAFNVLMAALPIALIWNFAARRNAEVEEVEAENGSSHIGVPSALAVLLLASLWPASVRWHGRPEMFTVLFLTLVYLFVMQKERKWWQFGGIALVFALWPNLHAGILMGIVALWVGVILETAQKWTKTRRFEPLLLIFAVVCSLIPLFSTPYGPRYLSAYGGTFETTFAITEWLPFWVEPSLNIEAALLLIGLWLVAAVLWALNPARRWAVLGWLLLMGVAFLQARRQLWLCSTTVAFALASAAPLLRGENIYRLLKRGGALEPGLRRAAHAGTLAILLAGLVAAFPEDGFSTVDRRAPVQMAEFLAEKAPAGRIFNDYEYSAGLEWFLNERRPLYIDLINAYPADLMHEYLDVIAAKPEALRVLDEKQIEVMALRPLDAEAPEDDPLAPLYGWIQKSNDWRLIYKEIDGHVWARR